MTKDPSSHLIEDLLYAYEHRLLTDPVGQAVDRSIAAGVQGKFDMAELTRRVGKHQTAQRFAGPFRRHELTRGAILLGHDLQGRAVRIPVQPLCAHSLTLGGSGSGKTTKSRWQILQVASRVPGLWLFDFRKREYACLVPYLAALGVDLIVVPARSLKLNPLQLPAGVDPHSWASRVADMLVQVFRLPARATKLLQLTVIDLFERRGVLRGTDDYPTLFDLREAIARNVAANPQARAAIVDVLDPVLMSLRSVLAYRRGWSSQDLAQHRIVFELDGVGEVEKDLILSSLVLPEFTSRVARGISNRSMNLWICCDEAARLVSTSTTAGGMADLIGLIRGSGLGLDLSIQSADIAPAVLSNTASKFIGRCGSSRDYDSIASAMGLSPDQRKQLATVLVPGVFVGQVGEGDWRHPFIYRVPDVDLSEPPHVAMPPGGSVPVGLLPRPQAGAGADVTCDHASGRHADVLGSLPIEPAPEFADWHFDPARRRATATSPADSQTDTHAAQPNNPPHVNGPTETLSDAERRFLRAVIDHPGTVSSGLARLASIGTHQAIAVRKRLIERGLVREHRVNTSNRGRASIVLEPLPAGLAAMQT